MSFSDIGDRMVNFGGGIIDNSKQASEIIINLGVRYATAFGLYQSTKVPSKARVSNDYKFITYPQEEGNFEDINFSFKETKINFGSLLLSQEFGKLLAPPPIISFSQDKELVETEINGSDNIVVERWGTKPWDIRMKGLLIDIEKRTYPEGLIKELYKFFKYNGVVDVIGTQFKDKDIQNLYFTGIEFNPIEGFEDTVQYSLNAKSIRAVGFTLLNPNA